MTTKTASAEWEGTLEEGSGAFHMGEHQRMTEPYSFDTRFKEGHGLGPEDLIAAAHAGCYSMALSHLLHEEGIEAERVATSADVSLEKNGNGFAITTIHLNTRVKAPGLKQDALEEYASTAAESCPVSKALEGVDISVEAILA
jgi:lipoyl-dependent peroxiredoxin